MVTGNGKKACQSNAVLLNFHVCFIVGLSNPIQMHITEVFVCSMALSRGLLKRDKNNDGI